MSQPIKQQMDTDGRAPSSASGLPSSPSDPGRAAVQPDVLALIGNTPMIRLAKDSKALGHNVLAKLDYLNPSGSVKDRIALYVLEKAERSGLIRRGDLIIDNSSGNTAISVAMVAAVKGYRALFTVPDKTSQEKIDLIKALGAEVVVCPTDVPHEHPDGYYMAARRIAKERGAYLFDQYNNPLNIESHYMTTGPEIWNQSEGKIDVFVAGIGTGGTLSGAARFLKERNPAVRVVAVDPIGSIFHNLFYGKELSDVGRYHVEGIGSDTPCGALDMSVVDDVVQVGDREAFMAARRLVREEGLLVGGSSGSAVAGLAAWVERQSRGSALNIVTILPDSGQRYVSKFLSDAWMVKEGFDTLM